MPPTLTKPAVAGLAAEGLGSLLRTETIASMEAASTAGEAIALLLASPEFQRR
jgi:hypothetical protein